MDGKDNISTRKKILIAAEEVFSESGFHKTLVEDISNRAGLGKGTIYRYFKNKKDLFQSLIFESLDELKGNIAAGIDRHETTIEKLKAGIKAYLMFFKEHKRLFAIVIFEHGEVGCDSHDECMGQFVALINVLTGFVKKCVDDKTLKSLDPEMLSYSMLGVVNYVIFKWMMSKKEYDIMDELDTIYEIIFKGVLR